MDAFAARSQGPKPSRAALPIGSSIDGCLLRTTKSPLELSNVGTVTVVWRLCNHVERSQARWLWMPPRA